MPQISTKCTITSHLNSLNIKKNPATDGVGNPVPGLEQAQKCGGVMHTIFELFFLYIVHLQNVYRSYMYVG